IDAAVGRPPRDALGEQTALQRLERMEVAEERGLGDGERLDHLAMEIAALPLGVKAVEQRAEGFVSLLERERREARLGQILLPRFERDAGALAHQLLDVREVRGADAGRGA